MVESTIRAKFTSLIQLEKSAGSWVSLTTGLNITIIFQTNFINVISSAILPKFTKAMLVMQADMAYTYLLLDVHGGCVHSLN